MANTNKFLDQSGLLYFWQQIKAKLANKVDVEAGKGLSTNDYTTAEKEKLAGIATGANKTTIEDVLTSTSAANALSANQGRVLNEKIEEVKESMSDLGYGDMMKSTYDADNDGKVDLAKHAEEADKATNADSAADASKLGGQAPSYYATASAIPTKTSQLANDSNFVATGDNISKLTNDAGYLTEHQDISGKLDKTGDGSNVTSTFTQASERANIVTGEKLSTILGKIAKYFADLKTVAFTGKYSDLTGLPTIPTVTNDLTNELKEQYDAAYAHSQAAHAPADAEKNVVVGVQVNSVDVAPDASTRKVNITVPTTVAQLSDASEYAKKTDIATMYEYKGSVENFSDLPTGAEVGDVYNVVNEKGMNYGWNGTEWDALGEVFSVDSITNAEIDTILAA